METLTLVCVFSTNTYINIECLLENHVDRGSSMTSKPVAFLLSDLGITKSHSRPYVSNDNPYSESQFKTLKYLWISLEVSAQLRMPGLSVRISLPGIIQNIIIQELV